jgi:O-antigen biosynthesis protein
MEVTTILLGDGPLRDEFEKLGPLIDFTRPHWRSAMSDTVAKARNAQLRQLRTAGYQHAICNTTVSGALVPLLHENGFKTLLLVHELPALLKQLNLTEVAAAAAGLADRLVFPASFVKDRFNEIAAVQEGRSVIRPQGLYRANPFRNKRASAKTRLTQLIELKGDAPIVVGAGPADRRKGIDIFCQVASLVARDAPTQGSSGWVMTTRTWRATARRGSMCSACPARSIFSGSSRTRRSTRATLPLLISSS